MTIRFLKSNKKNSTFIDINDMILKVKIFYQPIFQDSPIGHNIYIISTFCIFVYNPFNMPLNIIL